MLAQLLDVRDVVGDRVRRAGRWRDPSRRCRAGRAGRARARRRARRGRRGSATRSQARRDDRRAWGRSRSGGRRASARPPSSAVPSAFRHAVPPARSGVIVTSEKPKSESSRSTRSPAPAAVSSTSQPPGRSASRAASASFSVAPEPTSATCGSQSRTSGSQRRQLVRLDVRRVRDDEVEVGSPRPLVRSCSTRRSSTASPVSSAFSRASASASGETSIAVTRAPRRSSAIASAIAPVPVPTSSTCGSVELAEEREAALDDDLRLGPRDQRAPVDLQRQPPEAPLAEDVGERLARLARGRGSRRRPRPARLVSRRSSSA